MKNQSTVSGENKKNIYIYGLLTFLPSMLNVHNNLPLSCLYIVLVKRAVSTVVCDWRFKR